MEAYQGAYLKRYHPVEFLSCVLSNGKGFYSTLAYTLECRRLGIDFLPPDVNASRKGLCSRAHWGAAPAIRIPIRQIQELSTATMQRYAEERANSPFQSLSDIFIRVVPTIPEMQNLIRAGAFDSFGEKRTAQTWSLHHLARALPDRANGSLFPPDSKTPLPEISLTEPTYDERLKNEVELLGFTVSGHPLDQYAEIAWDTYCPIKDLAKYANQQVTVCGLIIQDRLFSQVTGDTMKFLTICDYSGMVECEIFADTYRRFGINTVRFPAVELTATVTPCDNGLGYSLQVQRIVKPRQQALKKAS